VEDLLYNIIMDRNQVEKRTMLENLDYVLLTMDELVDGGYLSFTLISVIPLPLIFVFG